MKGFSVVKTHTVSVLARPSEVWAFSSISEEKNKIKFVLIWHCYIIEEKKLYGNCATDSCHSAW